MGNSECEDVLDDHIKPALQVWIDQLPVMLRIIPIHDLGKEPSISIRSRDGHLNKLLFRCTGESLEVWTTLPGQHSGARLPLSQISEELIAEKIGLFVKSCLA